MAPARTSPRSHRVPPWSSSTRSATNHDHTFSLARSDDGSSWEAVDFPVVASSPDETVTARDLGTAGDLFVQLADVRNGDVTTGSIWTSPDGVTWTKAYEAPGVAVPGREPDPRRSSSGEDVEVISPDGVTWTPVPQPGLTHGDAATTLADGTVLVAGAGYGDAGPFATVQVVPAPVGFVPLASPAP